MKSAWLLLLLTGSAYAEGYLGTPDFMQGTKLYAGASIGQSQQGDSCNDPFFTGSCDDKDVAGKVFGGARFNPMFGAEVAYNKLGTTRKSGVSNGSAASMNNTLSGISVSGVGYLPTTPEIEAFGKAGLMKWERNTTQTVGTNTTNSQADGTSPLLGVGAQYRLNENLHLRSEWEHVFNVGADSAYETDADLYSVGISYSTL